MKHFIRIALLTLLLQPALLMAGERHGDHHQRHMEKMVEKLQLSDQQAAEFRRIMDEQHEKFRAFAGEDDANRGQRHGRIKALHDETRERLRAVLNEEQMARMEALHEQRMKKHMHGRHHDRDALKEKLGLSEQQASQVDEILRQQHEKKRELFKAEGDRGEKHARFKSLHDETRERLRAVLNEEQMAKMEALHEERRDRMKKHRHRHHDKEGGEEPAEAN